jgi:hypothetical protein
MKNRNKTNTTNSPTTLPTAMEPPTNMNGHDRPSVIVIVITHSPQLNSPQLDDSDFTMDKPPTHRSSQEGLKRTYIKISQQAPPTAKRQLRFGRLDLLKSEVAHPIASAITAAHVIVATHVTLEDNAAPTSNSLSE